MNTAISGNIVSEIVTQGNGSVANRIDVQPNGAVDGIELEEGGNIVIIKLDEGCIVDETNLQNEDIENIKKLSDNGNVVKLESQEDGSSVNTLEPDSSTIVNIESLSNGSTVIETEREDNESLLSGIELQEEERVIANQSNKELQNNENITEISRTQANGETVNTTEIQDGSKVNTIIPKSGSEVNIESQVLLSRKDTRGVREEEIELLLCPNLLEEVTLNVESTF